MSDRSDDGTDRGRREQPGQLGDLALESLARRIKRDRLRLRGEPIDEAAHEPPAAPEASPGGWQTLPDEPAELVLDHSFDALRPPSERERSRWVEQRAEQVLKDRAAGRGPAERGATRLLEQLAEQVLNDRELRPPVERGGLHLVRQSAERIFSDYVDALTPPAGSERTSLPEHLPGQASDHEAAADQAPHRRRTGRLYQAFLERSGGKSPDE